MRPPHLETRDAPSYNANWGTPDWILDFVRKAGHITEDLATLPEHNERVGAQRIHTPSGVFGPEQTGLLWCNPPGPKRVSIEFWDRWKLLQHRRPAAFLFFQADYMRNAYALDRFALFFCRRRIRFVGAANQCSFPSALVVNRDWLVSAGASVLSDPNWGAWRPF